MSVLIAGHSQIKFLYQYIKDPNVTCISSPGALLEEMLPVIHEAVEYFQVSIIFYAFQNLPIMCQTLEFLLGLQAFFLQI